MRTLEQEGKENYLKKIKDRFPFSAHYCQQIFFKKSLNLNYHSNKQFETFETNSTLAVL